MSQLMRAPLAGSGEPVVRKAEMLLISGAGVPPGPGYRGFRVGRAG
jgi:hypothetical protein